MMRTYLRPFTEEERAALERGLAAALRQRAPSEGRWPGCVFGFALFGLMAGLVAVAILRGGQNGPPAAPLFVVGAFTAAGAFLGYHAYRKLIAFEIEGRRVGESYWRQPLEQGHYEVTEVEASAVAVVLPAEDEAPMFFLEVGDGQALALSGYYLQEDIYDDDRSVALRFSLLRHPGQEEIVAVADFGERVAPARVLEADVFDEGYYPEDGEVLPVRLPTLRADLERIAKGREKE